MRLYLRSTFVLAALAVAACARAPVPPPAAPPPAAPAPWWRGAVFYEVFVRSFQDSNGDGKGDLPGLIQRLDYLNDGDPRTTTDLGVDALWLMPVTASPSYHGFDATDYEHVNRDYGTDADLDRLVAEAHRRGMRVILDLVLNHTSDQHPWFRDSASSATSPKRDWYVWSPTDLGWPQPWNPASGSTWHERNGAWYYALFWGGMPDLNYRTPAVREEAKRIARYWLQRGVDGFRLDAIRHLVESGPGPGQSGSSENHAFLRELRAAVREARPDAVLVGEVWSRAEDIALYYGTDGDELQLLFDFPLASAIVKSVNGGDATDVTYALSEIRREYPPGAVDAPFLTNHDQIRLATELASDAGKLRLAAAVLLTLPGAPFVYYGEELGMQQPRSSDDEFKRQPMPWDGSPAGGFTTGRPWYRLPPGHERANVAAESRDPDSLLSRYRALVAARHASPALARGDIVVLAVPSTALAWVRRGEGESVLVVHNLSPSTLEVPGIVAPGTAPEPVFADEGASLAHAGSGWSATLPPWGSGAWRLR
jgi:glycosidase